MSVVKRFFFYAIAIVTLGMFVSGVSIIVGSVADMIAGQFSTQIGRSGFSAETFSMGLALTIIGGIIWFLFWRSIQKAARGNIEEIGSAIRGWYLNLILLVSLATGMTAATQFIAWMIGGFEILNFQGTFIANLAVTALVWLYHYRIREGEGQPSPAAKTLKRWYIYIFSAWGLIWAIVGFVQLIYHIFVWLPIWGTTVSNGLLQGNVFGLDVAYLLVGAFIWWLHWLRMARGDIESTLRQVYLYLLAILGSVIAGLTALTYTLYYLLRYAFSGFSAPSNLYFQFLGWTVPLMLVAFGVWTYFRQVAQEESALLPSRQSSARRVYTYLMSLVGLGALIAGVVSLAGLLLRILADISSVAAVLSLDSGFWQSYLSLTLAFLAVGTPLWIYYWQKTIKMADAGGIEERRALTRRIYLYFLIAASVIALATGLSNIIYQILTGILQSRDGATVFRDSIWGLQAIAVALPVMLYHWKVLRADQKLGSEASLTKKKSIMILSTDTIARQLIPGIESRLGVKPRVLHYQSAPEEQINPLNEADIETALTMMESSPSGKIVLVYTAKGMQILPYEDK